jgi:hypothetical protein
VRTFKRLCVYAGSSDEVDRAYLDAAAAFGALLARRGITMVYGGGRVGMMGAAADAALAAGGEVIGVIPTKLRTKERTHEGLTELFVVEGMHARKSMMAHLSDAFVALPGGLGTLEEVFEAATWTVLDLHAKPVGLLNARGYYDRLVAFLEHTADEGFVRPAHRGLVCADPDPAALLDRLARAELPVASWI